MALIGRLFVILFGFLAACLVAGMIVVDPELDLKLAALFYDAAAKSFPLKLNALAAIARDGAMWIAWGLALPAMIVAAITEAFHIRSALAYAVGGGVVGLACYLGLVPFDPATLRFDGIVRRHLEIMTGAGIVAGLVYWMIAGRNAGAWREPPRPVPQLPPLPSHSPPPPPPPSS